MKSDVPEKMVEIISRMLWKAERYQIPALRSMVEWWLLARLGLNRQARQEYIDIVVGKKLADAEEAAKLENLA